MSDQARVPSVRQIEILQHTLGLDREKREPWRNYYCAEDGSPDVEAIVALGLMERGRTLNGERDRYYHVTEAGIAAAKAALPKPYTRAQQRYRRFLAASDALTDLTFREFLRMESR